MKTRWMASQKQLGPSTPKATVASILDCSICPGPHPPRPMSRANFVKLNGIKISCLVMPRREPPPPPSLPSQPTGCQAFDVRDPASVPAPVHTWPFSAPCSIFLHHSEFRTCEAHAGCMLASEGMGTLGHLCPLFSPYRCGCVGAAWRTSPAPEWATSTGSMCPTRSLPESAWPG